MESVRDAADLYLSLRHPPITLVCDTACTFVRHLNNREPDLTKEIWGAYDGCFEIPDKTVKPKSVKTSFKSEHTVFSCHPLVVVWSREKCFPPLSKVESFIILLHMYPTSRQKWTQG